MDFKYVIDQVHEQNHRKMSKTYTNSKIYVFPTILKKKKKIFCKFWIGFFWGVIEYLIP